MKVQATIKKSNLSARKLGQVTIEYLLLVAVSLSLLGISVLALSHIKENSIESLSLIESRSNANGFLTTVETVCGLGHGTRKSFSLKGNLSAHDDRFTINDQVAEDSTCVFNKEYYFSDSVILVENVHGELVLR